MAQPHFLLPSTNRLYLPPGDQQPNLQRLLVLVPPDLEREGELAERAWQLAASARLPVVLLGLAHSGAAEAQYRRRLASLAALTAGDGVAVTYQLALEQGWLPAVQRLWRPGDLVLCVAGQFEPAGWLGLGRQPLAAALRAALRTPLLETDLGGVRPALQSMGVRMSETLTLLSYALVIVGCLVFQGLVVRAADGVAESVLLVLSVIGEFALLRIISAWPSSGGD